MPCLNPATVDMCKDNITILCKRYCKKNNNKDDTLNYDEVDVGCTNSGMVIPVKATPAPESIVVDAEQRKTGDEGLKIMYVSMNQYFNTQHIFFSIL